VTNLIAMQMRWKLWPVTGDLSGVHLRLSWNYILSIQIKYSFIAANTIILSIKKNWKCKLTVNLIIFGVSNHITTRV
jgi:hypothetical protein